MIHPETHLVTPTNGPAPAGKPDRCFYCKVPIGGEHNADCVRRQRTVVLSYTFEVVVTVPESSDADHINFHRNEGTWCADNAVEYDLRRRKDGFCWCSDHTSTYVREATEDDVEKWNLDLPAQEPK